MHVAQQPHSLHIRLDIACERLGHFARCLFARFCGEFISYAAYRDCRLKDSLASAKLGLRWLGLPMRKLPANLELLLYLQK